MPNIECGIQPALPTEEELVLRARRMLPELRKRAARSAEERCLLPETIDDFRRAGFFKVLQPLEFGGYEMSPLSLCRLVIELGRADMSAGWVLFVLALHAFEVTLMGTGAKNAVWGNNPDALVASSVVPFGRMERVSGGYVVDGTWRFSSGIDHAQWIGIGGNVAIPGSSETDFRMCLIPSAKVQIDQNSWRTFGLCGTGSKDFTVTDLFVPEHLSHSLIDAREMRGQEEMASNYRYPFWVTFNALVAAAVVGGAKGAVDEAITQMKARVSSIGGTPAPTDPYIRTRIARAAVLTRTAEARLSCMYGEMEKSISTGASILVETRLRYMAELSQCGKDSEDAAIMLFKATGARGLALSNNMQTIVRNVLSGANHVAMNIDQMMDNLGGTLLGHENPHAMY